MENKITIIEGPPPTFEATSDGWAIGLTEGPNDYGLKITRLRTFNGPALVERCHRTWSQNGVMYLHYRNDVGLEERTPIMAARTFETDDGHVLMLWVRQKPDETEESYDLDDGEDAEN